MNPLITGPAGPIREEGDTILSPIDGSLQQVGILDTYFINLCKWALFPMRSAHPERKQ